uniref:Uncharacterized protein n=1 Tax=Bionectria ochroleuca TaxID=29856 RepID=A0A0B7KNE0_BIOOC
MTERTETFWDLGGDLWLVSNGARQLGIRKAQMASRRPFISQPFLEPLSLCWSSFKKRGHPSRAWMPKTVSLSIEKPLTTASLLIQQGSEPNVVDGRGLKPIHLTAKKNYYAVVTVLLEAGVEPNTTKKK